MSSQHVVRGSTYYELSCESACAARCSSDPVYRWIYFSQKLRHVRVISFCLVRYAR